MQYKKPHGCIDGKTIVGSFAVGAIYMSYCLHCVQIWGHLGAWGSWLTVKVFSRLDIQVSLRHIILVFLDWDVWVGITLFIFPWHTSYYSVITYVMSDRYVCSYKA